MPAILFLTAIWALALDSPFHLALELGAAVATGGSVVLYTRSMLVRLLEEHKQTRMAIDEVDKRLRDVETRVEVLQNMQEYYCTLDNCPYRVEMIRRGQQLESLPTRTPRDHPEKRP